MVEDAEKSKETLTTLTVDGDHSRFPAMSEQLRQRRIDTTKSFYLNAERGAPDSELEEACKEKPIITWKPPLFKKNTPYLDKCGGGPSGI